MSRLRYSLLTLVMVALAACEALSPSGDERAPETAAPASPESRALGAYYAGVQRDLLARGLLRTDGGGPDTPYTASTLARNFERIAFFEEYERDQGFRKSAGQSGELRRWAGPVRVALEFGASVPAAVQAADRATVKAYLARLAGVTGHPVSLNVRRANFHVLVMGVDDAAQLSARLRQIVPGLGSATLGLFVAPPRDIHCLVVAFSSDRASGTYETAIALVRAEHPDLMRESCYHEEIAQGLGLANDSPDARPSIFNDDDEFALLTSHDEALLAMLYDPRLGIGMTLDEARPVIQRMARERAGRLF
ncbi:DUF2927 domain-containing protein [Shimia sp.]|uniref:DUF2927 domain-containing protein n=1 Tax=Shimia sp. TaxID=1954381 RepID=UPI0035681970